jgi:hypothetical protein
VNEQLVTRQELADALKDLVTKRDLAEATEKLTEAIRDSQTEVLRAFYNLAGRSKSG